MRIETDTKLPQGWSSNILKEVIQKLTDGSHNPPKKQTHGLPMLSARNIENGYINFHEYRYIDPSDFELEDKRTQIKSGDVLLTIVGAIGRATVVPENIQPFTLQRSVAVLSSLAFTPKFLMYQFRSPKIQKELLGKAKGTAQKGIYLKKLSGVEMLIPPLNEQKRIVAKIEALQTRSSAVKEELEAIKPLLNQFRQSVLASAFRGDLTKDWREQNPDVEPAAKLIASLKTQNPEHYLDIFKQSCYYKLPKSWTWVQLGKLGTLLGGGTPSKRNPSFWNGHIPWISAKDMKIDRIKDSIDHITEEAISKSSAKIIPKSSILFVVRGMILNHTLPIAITDDVVTINQDMKALVPEIADMSEYLLFACKFVSKHILFKIKSATHGTRRLETSTLKDWAIPVPPISEQKEIVRRIESLFKLADSIENQQSKIQNQIETLNQSILAKAFRGELVPQDPNDELASVLLERIKAEREKAKPKKSKSKKKTKTTKVKQLGLDLQT